MAVAAVAVLTKHRFRDPAWVIVACVAAVGACAVAAEGGDWMENGRLMTPWLVLTCVLAGAWINTIRLRTIGVSALIAANLWGLLIYAASVLDRYCRVVQRSDAPRASPRCLRELVGAKESHSRPLFLIFSLHRTANCSGLWPLERSHR